MGNRSYVVFPEARAAVYLHWNGGIESVVAFLDYMNERRMGGDSYGAARFCQVVGNFFGGNLSVGVEGLGSTSAANLRALAQGQDNGAFIVERCAEGLRIGRWYREGGDVAGLELATRISQARAHPYNIKGELLASIRERNTAAASEAA